MCRNNEKWVISSKILIFYLTINVNIITNWKRCSDENHKYGPIKKKDGTT